MKYLHTDGFGKWITCPSTETLLNFTAGELTARENKKIAAHIAECDFCGAEAELLKKNPPRATPPPNAEMPSHLKRLAAKFFRK